MTQFQRQFKKTIVDVGHGWISTSHYLFYVKVITDSCPYIDAGVANLIW